MENSKMSKRVVVGGLAIAFALSAFCITRSHSTHAASISTPTPQQTVLAPTFNRDIAPIFFQNCASCHHPGEVAPFSLLTYADGKKHSSEIAELTHMRQMPPWKPAHG